MQWLCELCNSRVICVGWNVWRHGARSGVYLSERWRLKWSESFERRRLMSPAAKDTVDGLRRVVHGAWTAQWTRPQRATYTINTLQSDNKINDSKQTTAVGSWNNAHISRASYVDSGKPGSKITPLARRTLRDQWLRITPCLQAQINLAPVEYNQTSSPSLNGEYTKIANRYDSVAHCVEYRFKYVTSNAYDYS